MRSFCTDVGLNFQINSTVAVPKSDGVCEIVNSSEMSEYAILLKKHLFRHKLLLAQFQTSYVLTEVV